MTSGFCQVDALAMLCAGGANIAHVTQVLSYLLCARALLAALEMAKVKTTTNRFVFLPLLLIGAEMYAVVKLLTGSAKKTSGKARNGNKNCCW
jgi:hypothetical protein